MPNWCRNKLIVRGEARAVARWVSDAATDEKPFAPSAIAPGPYAIFWDFQRGEHSATYVFRTPWSPPTEWLWEAARLYPHLSFSLSWEEPGAGIQGRIQAGAGSPLLPQD